MINAVLAKNSEDKMFDTFYPLYFGLIFLFVSVIYIFFVARKLDREEDEDSQNSQG